MEQVLELEAFANEERSCLCACRGASCYQGDVTLSIRRFGARLQVVLSVINWQGKRTLIMAGSETANAAPDMPIEIQGRLATFSGISRRLSPRCTTGDQQGDQ